MGFGRSASPACTERPEARTVVGATITIKGEVSGCEDVIVLGRIEGQISLPGCNICVGREGWIEANLVGKMIRVDGFVQGNVRGEEQILVTGRIQGDVTAPRVILEEGSRFSGTVEVAPASSLPPKDPVP